MVLQARLLWTAAGGAGGETALHFVDSTPPADIVTMLQNFMNACRPALANSTSVAADPILRELNTATGALEGEELLGGNPNITGNGGTNAVPNAAQGLIRLRTSLIVNGRFVQGRIFIPGMASGMVSATGELSSTALSQLTTAGNALIVSGQPFQVWHRPQGGSGGSYAAVDSATAWNEFATQRRRRS